MNLKASRFAAAGVISGRKVQMLEDAGLVVVRKEELERLQKQKSELEERQNG